MNTDEAHDIVNGRRKDRAFFRWRRIWEGIRDGDTEPLEAGIGLVFYIFLGTVILLDFTAFPPPRVRFLLLQIPRIPITEDRLGWILVVIGVAQVLAIGTTSYRLRAGLAFIGGCICLSVTFAYFYADSVSYFQAWVAYAGLAILETYLVLRLKEQRLESKSAEKLVRQRFEAKEHHI